MNPQFALLAGLPEERAVDQGRSRDIGPEPAYLHHVAAEVAKYVDVANGSLSILSMRGSPGVVGANPIAASRRRRGGASTSCNPVYRSAMAGRICRRELVRTIG